MYSSFFFYFTRRPPISPLFPYTTLFRSVFARETSSALHDQHDSSVGAQSSGGPTNESENSSGGRSSALSGNGRAPAGDRKSTRLNSSHTVISYAVFCLKKKNTKVKKNNT